MPYVLSKMFYNANQLSCLPDGGVGGSCIGSIVCLDGHSSCIANICTCKTGFSDVDGVCTEGICKISVNNHTFVAYCLLSKFMCMG